MSCNSVPVLGLVQLEPAAGELSFFFFSRPFLGFCPSGLPLVPFFPIFAQPSGNSRFPLADAFAFSSFQVPFPIPFPFYCRFSTARTWAICLSSFIQTYSVAKAKAKAKSKIGVNSSQPPP
jgi:hypothetical protein